MKKTKNILYRFYAAVLFLLSFVLFSFPLKVSSQLLEANQPEQDACNAIELCNNSFTSTYSYQGVGSKMDLNNTPCGSGEGNSVWLKIKIQTAGKLAFLIKPINIHDDYDFAVLKNDGDCNNITENQVIRCNFNNNLAGSNIDGIIGLNVSSNEPFVQGGTNGHSFSQAIDAKVDDIYFIMINNYGYSGGISSGFTIDFSTSTASFYNTSIPVLQSIVPACDYTHSIDIHLSNYALCGSISADGSDFTLTNSDQSITFPIASANGVNCSGATGYARDIHIEMNDPLPNGDYIIQAKKGTDGNSILGLCNGETPENGAKITFSIKADSLKLVNIDSPACQKIKLIFNQTVICSTIRADGSQFWVTGPKDVKVIAAQPLDTCNNQSSTGILLTLEKPIDLDGIYILHSLPDFSIYGSCNSILYEDIQKKIVINSYKGLLKIIADTTVCALNDRIQLKTSNEATTPIVGFQYQWILDNMILSTTEPSPWMTINQPKNHFLVSTIDANGCVLRDTTNIVLEKFEGSVSPMQSSICLNDSLPLNASNNAVSYSWYQDASLSTLSQDISPSHAMQPTLHPSRVGHFIYYLVLQSAKKCLDTLSITVDVKPLPELSLSFKDTTINYGSSVQLIASGADYYSWTPTISLLTPNNARTLSHPIVNTDYLIEGSNLLGCKVTDTVIVKIFYQDYAYFPNAFTPNQDGKNDLFKARFFGKINSYNMTIYDRWGQRIFISTNPEIGWDGKLNQKEAPSGTYIWECSYYPEGQRMFFKKGTIVLIR